MKAQTKSLPVTGIGLIILLILLGLGGLGGGIAMLLDPTGASMGLPGDLLEDLPISSFILPGVFLILVMGIVPFIVAYGLWKKERWGWLASLGQGVILILWICFQFLLWGSPIAIQYLFFIWGFVLLLVALLPTTRDHFKT